MEQNSSNKKHEKSIPAMQLLHVKENCNHSPKNTNEQIAI